MQLTKYTRVLKFHVGLIIGLLGAIIVFEHFYHNFECVHSKIQTPEEMWEVYLCQQQALLDANKV